MISRATATPAGRFVQLPSNFISMIRVQLNTDPPQILQQVTSDELAHRYVASGSGRPAFFAIHEEMELDLNPASGYTFEMVYYGKFTPLSDSNTSNWLLANAPDAYLYASLVAAEPFLREDERISTWQNLYFQAVQDLEMQEKHTRFSGGSLRSQSSMPTP